MIDRMDINMMEESSTMAGTESMELSCCTSNFLLNLPVELVMEILKLLEARDVLHGFQATCRYSYFLSNDESLWRALCLREGHFEGNQLEGGYNWKEFFKENSKLHWAPKMGSISGFSGAIELSEGKRRARVIKDGNCMVAGSRPVFPSDEYYTELHLHWREEHWYRSIGLVPSSAPHPIDSNHKMSLYGWKLSSRCGRVGNRGKDKPYLPERISNGDKVGILVNTKGEIHFSLNGNWKGAAFAGVTDSSFYPMVYLYCRGDCATISRKRLEKTC